MMTIGRLVLPVLLGIATASGGAQSPALSTGDVVRVRAATLSGLRHAEITAVRRDSIDVALDLGGPAVPLAIRDIAWLEVSRGRPGMRGSGLVGATLGGVLGVLFASSLIERCSGDVCTGVIDAERPGHRALALAGGAVGGAGIGFTLGALTARERWSLVIDRLPRR